MKWHNFSILVCALAVSASASAAQFVFVSPTQGTPAPTQIGSFDRVSPSGYGSLAPSLYLSATELSLGSVHIGESVTKAFTVINNSPKSISGITASVTTLMGDADAHVDVKCSPPLTLYSAAANEACDVLVTFNTSSAGTQTFSINMQGSASSYESVKGEFTFTAEVSDVEQPVGSGPRISFVTTAEDPNPNMYFFDQSYPEDRFEPAPVEKAIRIQNTGDTILNEVIDVLMYNQDEQAYFVVNYSECGSPAGSEFLYNPDTDDWYLSDYPAYPVTLAPGETCAVHVSFDPMTSVLGFSAQGTLTANSPSAGIITAGLSGKNTDLIPSSLGAKFVSSLDDSEIPGWLDDLRNSNEFISVYLTQVGMFEVPITGTESVTIDSVSITPLVGWAQQDALIFGGGGQGYHCVAGGEITFADQSCLVYVGFQAVNGSNQYSFRLDATGTSASGAPVTISRTISGVIPHELGVSPYVNGYSINLGSFNDPMALMEMGCSGGSWCGVYQASVGNTTQEPVVITSVSLVASPGYADYDISRVDRGCNSASVYTGWWVQGPDDMYPGLYYLVDSWSDTSTCQDSFAVTRGANFTGDPGQGYMEADFIVNYFVPSTGQSGSITEHQYVPLVFIQLLASGT